MANNGEKALRIARSDNPPHLILPDIMMPGLDGYEVCRQLKADEATRGIPINFLTAKTEVEDEQQGLELGAVDYITKPVTFVSFLTSCALPPMECWVSDSWLWMR